MWKALFALTVLVIGCDDTATPDEPCDLVSYPIDPTRINVGYPSLDCPSRLCISMPDSGARSTTTHENGGTCTASCFSDDDCADQSDASCSDGFTCVVPMVEGSACCLRMCVCRDDRALLPSDEQVAASCSVTSSSTCQNLPGRY